MKLLTRGNRRSIPVFRLRRTSVEPSVFVFFDFPGFASVGALAALVGCGFFGSGLALVLFFGVAVVDFASVPVDRFSPSGVTS